MLFVTQLSLGESIWSPRWYDYSMSVAPEGREGVFTAMASAPLFLGKFVTGACSASLMVSYSKCMPGFHQLHRLQLSYDNGCRIAEATVLFDLTRYRAVGHIGVYVTLFAWTAPLVCNYSAT